MTETSKRSNRRKRNKRDHLSEDNISPVPSNVGCNMKETINETNHTNNNNPNNQQHSCRTSPNTTVNGLPKQSDYHQGTVNKKRNSDDKKSVVITTEEGNNSKTIVELPSTSTDGSGKKLKKDKKRQRTRNITTDDSQTDNTSSKKKSRVNKQPNEVNQDAQQVSITSIPQHHRIELCAEQQSPTTEALALHSESSYEKNLPLTCNANNDTESSSPSTTTKKKKKKKKKKRGNKDSDSDVNNRNHGDVSSTTATTNRTEQKSTKSSLSATPSGLDNGNDSIPDFPYPVESDDHCESPLAAYEDIIPLLQKLNSIRYGTEQSSKNDVNKTLKIHIYDPYYCDGAMKRNLEALGFENVYHVKEDCYAIWDGPSEQYPNPMDVLITNPPYSGDHVEKLIHHITSSGSHFARNDKSGTPAAWFLLLPTWVHKKDYYITATNDIQPFYLVPRKRYVYKPPTNFRIPTKSDVHKKSSPFTSMWYCYGGSSKINEILIQYYLSYTRPKQQNSNASLCDLARSKSALRDLRRKQR